MRQMQVLFPMLPVSTAHIPQTKFPLTAKSYPATITSKKQIPSAGIGIIIIMGAVKIILESAHILLEGVPKEIDIKKIVEDIKAIDDVQGIHTLHVWSICSNIHVMSAHVDIKEEAQNRRGEILDLINQRLAKYHHIFYTTLQAECNGCITGQLFRAIEHKEHGH